MHPPTHPHQFLCFRGEGSEVQRVPLVGQPGTARAVELTVPAPVFLDGQVLLHQEWLGDVLLVVPDHHVTLKLQRRRSTEEICRYSQSLLDP